MLVFVSGFLNGWGDLLQFKFSSLRPWFHQRWDYWDPQFSWKNKYKDQDPTKGPRFPGSTTFLVFVTDGWHLLKSGRLLLMKVALLVGFLGCNYGKSLLWWFGAFLILTACHSAGFHISYTTKLFKKNSDA